MVQIAATCQEVHVPDVSFGCSSVALKKGKIKNRPYLSQFWR